MRADVFYGRLLRGEPDAWGAVGALRERVRLGAATPEDVRTVAALRQEHARHAHAFDYRGPGAPSIGGHDLPRHHAPGIVVGASTRRRPALDDRRVASLLDAFARCHRRPPPSTPAPGPGYAVHHTPERIGPNMYGQQFLPPEELPPSISGWPGLRGGRTNPAMMYGRPHVGGQFLPPEELPPGLRGGHANPGMFYGRNSFLPPEPVPPSIAGWPGLRGGHTNPAFVGAGHGGGGGHGGGMGHGGGFHPGFGGHGFGFRGGFGGFGGFPAFWGGGWGWPYAYGWPGYGSPLGGVDPGLYCRAMGYFPPGGT